MTTLTGRATRTLSGYVITLLEYPRWLIERDVDFTDCKHGGRFNSHDEECTSCEFGTACRWLNTGRDAPGPDTPLTELLAALGTAVRYLRSPQHDHVQHVRNCDCDTCEWLREAQSFLRQHRHRA